MGVMDLFHLSGKVVLVTGAGSGLGEGFVQAMAEAGATVACADIDVTSAHKTADHIRALGRQATAVDVDVAQEASVQRMVETTVHPLKVGGENADPIEVEGFLLRHPAID